MKIPFFEAFLIIHAISTFLYFVLISYLLTGWFKIKFFNPLKQDVPNIKISIVVAMRNEAHNIKCLLKNIGKQTYPYILWEIILVDDHSTDNSLDVANKYLQQLTGINSTVLSLPPHEKGKKHALKLGIKQAKNELIITTDADCSMGLEWLFTIASYYSIHQPDIIVAPVLFKAQNSFEKLQALEFLTLIGSGAGALGMNNPILANGANFCFTKKLFDELKGYDDNFKEVSGDDIFLLLKAKKLNKKILFLKSLAATITTKPQANLLSFINQRKRWVAKTKYHRDFFTLFSSGVVFCTNFFLFVATLYSFFNNSYLPYLFLFFGIKTLIDYCFLIPITSFFGMKKLLLLLIPEQILYIFYVSFITTISFVGKVSWKGRKY